MSGEAPPDLQSSPQSLQSPLADRARAVREGEQLDVQSLERHLGAALGLGALTVLQFPSGHSNLTYLLRSGERELVLRRPPFGSRVKSAHDMGREYRILSRLHAVFPAPRPLLQCEDESVIGAPFYVMERVSGIVLRKTLPKGLDFNPTLARRLSETFIDTLAALHAVDFRAIGLGDLGRPEGYVARQVSGWTKRYHESQTDDVPAIDRAAAWLAERIPPESAPLSATLLHNDYKFDNLILDFADPTRILAVLDWEMATVGDPLMDLGTALSYWIEAGDSEALKALAFGPTGAAGSLTRRELAERYGAKTGRNVGDLAFYLCFALFKTAVVVQQIFYRYRQGLTKDERFAGFLGAAKILGAEAVRVADSGRIDP